MNYEKSLSLIVSKVSSSLKLMTDLLEQAIAKVKQLPESEQDNIAQIILKELETKAVDFWDEFDEILEDCQVSTGIKDLSYQHDHYIHGTPKSNYCCDS